MIDQRRASKAVNEGFDLWVAGEPERAVPFYEEALRLVDPNHSGLPEYHGAFASILAELGRPLEARAQLQLSLAANLRHQENEFTTAVIVSRYFLANHYLQHDLPLQAIEAVAPSLGSEAECAYLLNWIRMLAFSAIGREEDAEAEKEIALKKAPTDKKRAELRELLIELENDEPEP
jgi:tetratricopeptide (TPR) repeat protein